MRTIWLTQEQVEAINAYLLSHNDAVAQNIRKELTIAKVRSSNNRVLKSVFISVLGKKDSSPYRFRKEEIELIENIIQPKDTL